MLSLGQHSFVFRNGSSEHWRVMEEVWQWLLTMKHHLAQFARSLGFLPPPPTIDSRRYWERRGKVFLEQLTADPQATTPQEVIESLETIAWNSLLEVGCGFGARLQAIQHHFPHTTLLGVDFSFTQLRRSDAYAPQHAWHVVHAEAHHLPCAPQSVDVVLAYGFLACIPPLHLPAILSELCQVSRQSVVVVDYAREHMDSPVRRQRMSNAEWYGHCYTDVLPRAGLRILRSQVCQETFPDPARLPVSLFHCEKITA